LNDFFKELGTNQDEYFFHFADSESAFSILCDGVIHPFSMRSSVSKPKFFSRKKNYDVFSHPFNMRSSVSKAYFSSKKYVYLMKCNPFNDDVTLAEEMFITDSGDINFITNFHKLEYAFAFRKDKLKDSVKKMRNYFGIYWLHKGQIKLNEHDFIMMKKRFRYEH